jgi:predicted DCC family thiol-disulfide oxidoreductase YuxK
MISVHTETTEKVRGWVLYDADCQVCCRWAGCAHELLARRGWHLAPLQAGWARKKLDLKEGEPMLEMKMLIADGQILGGADALVRITRSIWWAWPLFLLAQIPGCKPVLRAVYRGIARNRYCLGGRCVLPPKPAHHQRHLTTSFYDIP